jgi:hypothetical protein
MVTRLPWIFSTCRWIVSPTRISWFTLSLHNFDAVGVEVMQITRGILSISCFRNAAAGSHEA